MYSIPLFPQGKYNVIVVGWGNGAFNLNYPQVVSNTRVVARQIAKLLEVLQQTKDLDFDSVHLIGFSVGAHLAGLVTWDLGYKVGRITGTLAGILSPSNTGVFESTVGTSSDWHIGNARI